jgi:hypothetical protein
LPSESDDRLRMRVVILSALRRLRKPPPRSNQQRQSVSTSWFPTLRFVLQSCWHRFYDDRRWCRGLQHMCCFRNGESCVCSISKQNDHVL